MRRRRAARPASASRESVAVAGSGTGAVYALVMLMYVSAFGIEAAPVFVNVAKLKDPTTLDSTIENET